MQQNDINFCACAAAAAATVGDPFEDQLQELKCIAAERGNRLERRTGKAKVIVIGMF